MFKFFSRNKSLNPAFGSLKTDMHSHLLPGIDDGAQDVTASLELIRGMKDAGYSKLITTPHIMWDFYRNTRDQILEMADEMRDILKEQSIEIELAVAAEYFLDEHVMGLVKKKEPLLTFGGNMVLSEFSLASPPMDLKEMLFELRMHDYQPVIAHPERYIYLEQNKEFYDELKDAGYLFQLNILSFAGVYGRTAADLAHHLAKKQYYDFIGTDIHNARHLKNLQHSSIIDPVNKLLESGKIRNIQL